MAQGKLDFYGGKDGKKSGSGTALKVVLGVLFVLFVAFVFLSMPKGGSNSNNPACPSDWYANYTDGGTKVAVVEFSDFLCPYCARAAPTVSELKAYYGGRISFVYEHFIIHGVSAQKAAEASECARDQGLFDAYQDKLFANQAALLPSSPNTDALKRFAGEVGADRTAFDSCLDGGAKGPLVQAQMNEGVCLGVQATPTFFVNGKKMEGALPIDQFKRAIDPLLAR